MGSTLYLSMCSLLAMNLSERIQTIIDEKRTTKAELSRIAGVSKTAVKMWLDGTTQAITWEKAKNIEEAWGFRAEWIMSDKKPKYAQIGLSREMKQVIERLVQIDAEGGERRADVIYFINKLIPPIADESTG